METNKASLARKLEHRTSFVPTARDFENVENVRHRKNVNFVFRKQNLSPVEMFRTWLNWKTSRYIAIFHVY